MRRTELLQEVRKMRFEEACGGWQERRPTRGIDTMDGANRSLAERYRAAFNEEFTVPAVQSGTAFVPFIGPGLAEVLCEHGQPGPLRELRGQAAANPRPSFPRKREPTAATSSRRGGGYIVPLMDAWRYSTGRASSPGTSPPALPGGARVLRAGLRRSGSLNVPCAEHSIRDSSLPTSRGPGCSPGRKEAVLHVRPASPVYAVAT